MRSIVQLVCFAVIVPVWLSSVARSAADDQASERLKTEAQKLFHLLVEDMDLTPCSFNRSWSGYPVPEDFARKYLGSTVHADLIGPMSGYVDDIVDPDHMHIDAFCTVETLRRLRASWRSDFEKGYDERMDFANFSVSFPVFSNGFDDAALVLTIEHFSFSRWKDRVVRSSFFATTDALAFHRTGGSWAGTGNERLSTAE